MLEIRTVEGYAKETITFQLTEEEQQMTAKELFATLYTPFGGYAYKTTDGCLVATIYND